MTAADPTVTPVRRARGVGARERAAWAFLAPALIASEAAVCRSSCGVSPGSPMARAAASNQAERAFRLRSTAPCGEGKASSSAGRVTTVRASSSTRKRPCGR